MRSRVIKPVKLPERQNLGELTGVAFDSALIPVFFVPPLSTSVALWWNNLGTTLTTETQRNTEVAQRISNQVNPAF